MINNTVFTQKGSNNLENIFPVRCSGLKYKSIIRSHFRMITHFRNKEHLYDASQIEIFCNFIKNIDD